MASFQAKICWERPRKRENKNYCDDQFLTNLGQRIPKKLKLKLKNTNMASFQAKTGWETPRKRENKNYHSDQFLPNMEMIIPKKQRKN